MYKPFIFTTSEHACFGLTDVISWCITWKDAETGRDWIWPTFVRTNYGKWGKKTRY